MTRITYILEESAIEVIPREIRDDKMIRQFCLKRGKHPEEVLLDQSYHHKAILKLANNEMRGRPDIIHFCLLEATSTPLYFKGQLDVYAHTLDDKIIKIEKNVRLPRVYERFVGLMEKLYVEKIISYKEKRLLTLSKGSFEDLLNKIRPSTVIGLSSIGKESSNEKVAKYALRFENPVFIVGGFAKGHFGTDKRKLMDNLFSISRYSLNAHIVTARILYETEKIVLA
jgi:rRNA small subunit pseudouridine methyltransferase Nep1